MSVQLLDELSHHFLRFAFLLKVRDYLVHNVRHNISVLILRRPPRFSGLLSVGDEVLLFLRFSFPFWFLLCFLQFKIGLYCEERLGTFWTKFSNRNTLGSKHPSSLGSSTQKEGYWGGTNLRKPRPRFRIRGLGESTPKSQSERPFGSMGSSRTKSEKNYHFGFY